MTNFMKNMALVGGSLVMLGVPQPWPYSFERAIAVAAAQLRYAWAILLGV
jgi:hypothetical protein